MKKYLILLVIVLMNVFCYGQVDKPSISTQQIKIEKYLIGIGNENNNMYSNVLLYLQNNQSLKVYVICETHHVIGVKTSYKSYDILRDIIIGEFPDVMLFVKDESIFELDCKDEILKQ